MKIQEMKEELQKDLEMDVEILHSESIRIPGLHGKWLGFALDEQGKLMLLRSKYKRLKGRKLNYYLGRGTAAEYKANPFNLKILKSEVQSYLDADPQMRELEDQITSQEILVNFLEGAVRAITAKQWNIKNAIEFLKFKNGVM